MPRFKSEADEIASVVCTPGGNGALDEAAAGGRDHDACRSVAARRSECGHDVNAVLLEIQFEENEERIKALGMTASGRILAVVLTVRGEAIRPITAYAAPRRLQKLYAERRGA